MVVLCCSLLFLERADVFSNICVRLEIMFSPYDVKIQDASIKLLFLWSAEEYSSISLRALPGTTVPVVL